MPQSLHILNVHIIFSTKERRPWLTSEIRSQVWAYQSRILQNLECNDITIGGVADHIHVLCNLTKKSPVTKVLEILKKDSSRFVKTLSANLRDFCWQDGYGIFSVSPSHLEAVRQYILQQEEHHKKETFQQEYLRILKKYKAPFDELSMGLTEFWLALTGRRTIRALFRGRCPRLKWLRPLASMHAVESLHDFFLQTSCFLRVFCVNHSLG